MAICDVCEREMLKAPGCVKTVWLIEGNQLDAYRFGDEPWYGVTPPHAMLERCHDCCCKVGEYHHPGCDSEQCPSCFGQAIACGCSPCQRFRVEGESLIEIPGYDFRQGRN